MKQVVETMIDLICNDEELIFSGEFSGFTAAAEVHREYTAVETDDFWQQLINLFI